MKRLGSKRCVLVLAFLCLLVSGLAAGEQPKPGTKARTVSYDAPTAAAARTYKLVVSGECGEFQMLDMGGTAHYYLTEWIPGPCGECECCYRSGLCGLTYLSADPNFLYYATTHDTLGTRFFAVSRDPYHTGCVRVWRYTAEGYSVLGRFWWHMPE